MVRNLPLLLYVILYIYIYSLDELPVYKEALRDAGYEGELELNPPKYATSS